MVPSASRVAMLPTTLQMATERAPRRLRLAQRAERVGGFARLRDGDGQRPAVDDRLSVAILRPVVHFDRHARDLFDQELADEARVPRRAAREDDDAVDGGERRTIELHLFEEHLAGLERGAARARSRESPTAARESP